MIRLLALTAALALPMPSLASDTPPTPARELRLALPGAGPLFVDDYRVRDSRGVVVLFHQAGGSARGEYGFLVPRLLDAGFSVIAADLHGGGDRFGQPNRTEQARPAAEAFTYCDARPELDAVLRYARSVAGSQKLIAVGSSYSAALVVNATAQTEPLMDAAAAFSPASGGPMAACRPDDHAEALRRPVLLFRPAGELEVPSVAAQVERFDKAGVETFVASGVHGASLMNAERSPEGAEAAWGRFRAFLDAVVPPRD